MLPRAVAETRCFAAVPPAMPGHVAAEGTPWTARTPRAWKVAHACDCVEFVLPLTEAQVEAGMRPAVLTRDGWFNPRMTPSPAAPLSLVHAWREVRRWRNVLEAEQVGMPGEILHAHGFAPAMAGIRAGLPVVYDLQHPVGSTVGTGPWLLRSLRLAESFALCRAGAVVVHSQAMWNFALEQGVRAEDLFLVPDPVNVPSVLVDLVDDTAWLVEIAGTVPTLPIFAAGMDANRALGAFAVVAEESQQAHLLIECEDAAAVLAQAAVLGLAGCVHPVNRSDRRRALAGAAFVVTGAGSGSPNPVALAAMSCGRALLAADVPENREVSPQGRGCLWYAPGNDRDLAFRAAFLARNADFRDALGANGSTHIQATRAPLRVARRYDEVYRHVLHGHIGGRRPDIFHHVPAIALC